MRRHWGYTDPLLIAWRVCPAAHEGMTIMAFQILALSGGGFLGLYSAQILAHLEAQAEVPLGRCFDLICGTSIGGIMALGLGMEKSAKEIRQAFESHGPTIFPPRPRRFGLLSDVLQFGWKPKYEAAGLRKTVESIIGPDALLGDSKHRLLVPSVNMTKGETQMFKTPHHQNFLTDHAIKMADIAMATSAAPLFFPMAEVGDSLYVDGGLYANAPDMCGIHEATHFLGVPTEDIHVLSIGTTTSSYSLPHKWGVRYGAAQWITNQRIVSTVISAQQQLTTFMVGHLLGSRYLRLDTLQSPEQNQDLALDNAAPSAQRTIRGMADAVYQKASGTPLLKQMLQHRAPTPTFFLGSNATPGAQPYPPHVSGIATSTSAPGELTPHQSPR
jgi:uncharacterized protein